MVVSVVVVVVPGLPSRDLPADRASALPLPTTHGIILMGGREGERAGRGRQMSLLESGGTAHKRLRRGQAWVS
ncbi:MAG: hypothetical protein DHS20C03_34520 [Minwuia thermotolerans]|nr:MAG: hypothetical protein DHS20C03_34520 [Minwuia thermotolerans]